MEDSCNHLSKVKGKMEQSLDECEDALEKEKKSKGVAEKMKRKIEGGLKLTKEAVSDLERIRSSLAPSRDRLSSARARRRRLLAKIED